LLGGEGVKKTSKTALGGIIAALSLTLLFSVSIVPFFSYALPATAAALLIPIIIEINYKWAFGVYFSVSLLGIFIVPEKEVAVMYLSFFGYYVILKFIIEKRIKGIFAWFIKLVIFNLSTFLAYVVMMKFMGVEVDEVEKFGIIAIPLLLLFGSFAFVLYDIALTRVIILYIKRFKKHVERMLR